MSLRPHLARAAGRITDIAPWRDGYAVTTPEALELFDASLVRTTSVPMCVSSNIVDLDDGRLVAGGATLHVLGEAGPVEAIELGAYCMGVVPTPDRHGFSAIGSDRIVFDHHGRRATVRWSEHPSFGRWRGGLAIADRTGLRLHDPAGAVVASTTEYLTKSPIALGELLVIGALRDVRIYDERANHVGTLDVDAKNIFAFARGVVIETRISEDTSRFAYHELEGTTLVERWALDTVGYASCEIAGAYLAIKEGPDVHILDDTGEVRAALEELGYIAGVARFEDGVVICADTAQWWRPDHEIVALDYDGRLATPRTVPAGLASSEHDLLLVWRTDRNGPEPIPLETDLPIGVEIVVDGDPLVVEGLQRFSLRVRYGGSGHTSSRPPAYRAWRHPTTRDEAVAIRDRLIARTFDGPLPPIPTIGEWRQRRADLAQLPLAATVDLVGRGMFAPAGLEPEILEWAQHARVAFFYELSIALGTSMRQLVASIRARTLALRPPRPVIGYEYLGSFTTSGALTVADPCYLGSKPTRGFSLTHSVQGLEGLWHVFVRPAQDDASRNAELVVLHEGAFAVSATHPLGLIGVDAGCAGVFDKACAKPNLDAGIDEGVVAGLGAVAHSGFGDGMYPAFVGSHHGKVAKIRIVFIDDAPEIDRMIANASTGPAKPYRASARFAVGDTIEHPKFGLGSVLLIVDSKIDVRFADATRTLVHAKAP